MMLASAYALVVGGLITAAVLGLVYWSVAMDPFGD
jgi:hypothetical protein